MDFEIRKSQSKEDTYVPKKVSLHKISLFDFILNFLYKMGILSLKIWLLWIFDD